MCCGARPKLIVVFVKWRHSFHQVSASPSWSYISLRNNTEQYWWLYLPLCPLLLSLEDYRGESIIAVGLLKGTTIICDNVNAMSLCHTPFIWWEWLINASNDLLTDLFCTTNVTFNSGAVMFLTDILRRLTVPYELDFIRVSSYHGTKSSGSGNHDKIWQFLFLHNHIISIMLCFMLLYWMNVIIRRHHHPWFVHTVQLKKDMSLNPEGRHVLIIEDLIDSGLTVCTIAITITITIIIGHPIPELHSCRGFSIIFAVRRRSRWRLHVFSTSRSNEPVRWKSTTVVGIVLMNLLVRFSTISITITTISITITISNSPHPSPTPHPSSTPSPSPSPMILIWSSLTHSLIVGYGMDFNEQFRCLPFVGVLRPEAYQW